MSSFEITSQGISASYYDGEFSIGGTSTDHALDNGDDWEWTVPRIKDMPVRWRIVLTNKDVFTAYKTLLWKPEHTTPRLQDIENYFSRVECMPVGILRRWDHAEPISLAYHYPNDPTLAAFLMGVATSGKEIEIFGQGWLWSKGDEPQAAASVPGFMERFEPAFTLEFPVLRMKNGQDPH